VIGFLGTGRITEAMVEGLSAHGEAPPIIVSPRNAETARRLAARFPSVTVARGNQDVLDHAATIVVALRAEDAVGILRALAFRADHLVVTVIGTMARDAVAALVAPASRVVRAGPTPSAAQRQGPVPYFPRDAEAAGLVALMGAPIAVADEREFHLLWCLVSLIATHYALLEDAACWAAEQGVDPARARAFLAAQARALGDAGAGGDFAARREAAATKGGLNQQALDVFRAHGGDEALRRALESVWARLARLSG
jgi:pyrroline-5-carboxylate reductase